jgi:Helicase HerA, central domain
MNMHDHQLCIGARTSGVPVMLDAEERRRHLYVIGQTGTGKSTLILNLIQQDLVAGQGLALLDPHGDLAESVLAHVPKARTNDLVYINPADVERPVGFNPLSRVAHDLKPIVADGVVSAFRHVWPESWGPRLDYILTNAVRALLDIPGATLLMLPRLLIDDLYRARIEHHISDPVVRSFWLHEYAGYSTNFRAEAISPIQNKIGKALMEPRLRNMLAQPTSTITPRRLMDESAVVICNLSKGRLGESTAHLLGALLTTAFAQAALSRADTPLADRRIFHFYADEFQSFAYFVRSEKVRAYLVHRASIPCAIVRSAACRGVRQCRIDHRLPSWCGRYRDPRSADRLTKSRSSARPSELWRLGALVAERHADIANPSRSLRCPARAARQHTPADRHKSPALRSAPRRNRASHPRISQGAISPMLQVKTNRPSQLFF